MKIGAIEIDFDAHEIRGPAGIHSIEPKVMQVLSVLVGNANEVVTREVLIDEVWGVGYGGDERLSRAVSLLRKSLSDAGADPNCIQTIPKSGYKFISEGNPFSMFKTPSVNVAPFQDAITTDTVVPVEKKRNWSGLLSIATAILLIMAAIFNFTRADRAALKPETPLVMVMDSAHPARIYDDQVKEEGGTNADILSDILADLPIRTQKELISPNWHRYEAVTQFDPDLIVIHYSGFKQEDSSGDRPQLRLLIDYFQKTDTKFLVYSRASNDWLDENMNIVLEELYTDNPDLQDRIDIFPLLEYGEPHWMDQGPAQGIKLKIKDILALQ
ncbi:MAG: hypothetical protein HKN36_12670 [Hellea sp.]|nr:hypothetical protein [Hellea sp.]